ncbi:hypothetical protein H0266_17985 [Halobacillus locisalis]|uniref:YppG-like protein n=1 Tax=Halobacillus locisalis TaxID=220753 RepID=A0A838CXX8_9BACI|nr:YppG family protein [Halobacillus locisalis]MBA2176784.1 hypothetical protein [Halobacillus locisalis]
MYPNYYNQWQDWTRYQAAYVQGRSAYPNRYQNNGYHPQVNPQMYGYAPQGYGYQQQPYPYSYAYPGYTEPIDYGKQNPQAKGFQAGAIPKTMMNYFQDEQGQLDFDKMMSTTGQVMKTVKEVSPIVKGIGAFVKGIK